jgi:hypothetical protein
MVSLHISFCKSDPLLSAFVSPCLFFAINLGYPYFKVHEFHISPASPKSKMKLFPAISILLINIAPIGHRAAPLTNRLGSEKEKNIILKITTIISSVNNK